MSRVATDQLREIAEVEFADIVVEVIIPGPNELRILLLDGTFIDVWYSLKMTGRYSYHWERRAIDGTLFRHDNAPHKRWHMVKTFPSHFHDGSESNVSESYLSQQPEEALREFLAFARAKLQEGDQDQVAG